MSFFSPLLDDVQPDVKPPGDTESKENKKGDDPEVTDQLKNGNYADSHLAIIVLLVANDMWFEEYLTDSHIRMNTFCSPLLDDAQSDEKPSGNTESKGSKKYEKSKQASRKKTTKKSGNYDHDVMMTCVTINACFMQYHFK